MCQAAVCTIANENKLGRKYLGSLANTFNLSGAIDASLLDHLQLVRQKALTELLAWPAKSNITQGEEKQKEVDSLAFGELRCSLGRKHSGEKMTWEQLQVT